MLNRQVSWEKVIVIAQNAADKVDPVLARVFAACTLSATFCLVLATFVALLIAYKFGAHDFGPGAWLTFGRLRPIHINDTFYGWVGIGLVGAAYYIVARSGRTRLHSEPLAWTGSVLFNLAALLGTVALDLGYNAGDLEYREWPWPIRLIFAAALIVTAWNLLATVAHRKTEDIYLSNWYTMGGVLLLRARGAGLLDQSRLLSDHRRASFPLQPSALVAANDGYCIFGGDARAGVGRQRELPPYDTRSC